MKKLILSALILCMIFLSACITIIEKYTINKNGSGTMEYIIDMSVMYEMMATFSDSAARTENSEIDQSMRAALPGLKLVDGISNIELTGDLKKYIAGVRFDFRDVKALNMAMAVVLKGEESASSELKYVDISKKLFTRYNLTSDEFNKEDLLGSEELDAETIKSVLESMKYKIIVNFEKPVKKVTTQASYTLDDKTVSIETNFAEIFDKEDWLRTVIKTK